MAEDSQTFLIFEALKAHLRAHHLTYRDIGERLDLSEASVKRIFSLKNCDVSRLAAICEAAGTTLIQLAAFAGEVKAKTFELPAKAAEFFAEHIEYLIFFRHLTAGYDPEQLAKERGLDQKSLARYLQKLEELELIERLPNGAINLKVEGYMSLPNNSLVHKRLLKEWAPFALKKAVDNDHDEAHWLRCFSTGLLPEHRTRLKHDLEELMDRYRHQGFLDQSLAPAAAQAFGTVIALVPYRVGEGLPIPRV